MEQVDLKIPNQIIENKKTGEELFCHRNFMNTKLTIKRMAKKNRRGTIMMRIIPFSAFAQNANARMLSEPVLIGGHSWRILAFRRSPPQWVWPLLLNLKYGIYSKLVGR